MKVQIAALAAVTAIGVAGCTPPAPTAAADAPVTLENDTQKFSYAAGYEIGERLNAMNEDVAVDLATLTAGMRDAYGDADAKMSVEDMTSIKQSIYKKAAEMRNEKREAEAQAKLEAGKTFLEENKSKDGVQVTESGLQYLIEEEGEGEHPAASDTVKVNYRGTLIDGTEFDSSYKRNAPATFKLSGVIKGWTEGLQFLKPGGKAKLFIPPELAYGQRGAGQLIGPNETLVFEVELLEIVGTDQAKAAE